jgi:hypothetical protein
MPKYLAIPKENAQNQHFHSSQTALEVSSFPSLPRPLPL